VVRLICLYTVEFVVANIKEIKWSLMPFDYLTLPDEQKETIMAITETSCNLNSEFNNIIVRKGRSVIILL
jgi:hypothetical protein